MAHDLTSDEVRDLLGAYALGALDDDERRAVEHHLLVDADARAELHALQLGAAWLEQSSERPSPTAWDRIAEQLDDNSAAAPLLSARRPRVATRPARILGIAAAILAVVVIVGGVRSVAIDDTNLDGAALAAAMKVAGDVRGAKTVALRSPDGGVAARAVVLPSGSGFVTSDLRRLSDRRTYELWGLTDDGPIPLGLLGREPRAHTFTARVPISGIAVTTEPRGGSPEPTGPVVASGELLTT